MGRARKFVTGFVVWTAYGLFMTWMDHNVYSSGPRPITWKYAFVLELSGAYIFGLLSPAVVWLAKRFPLVRVNLLRNVAVHISGTILYAVVTRVAWELWVAFLDHPQGDFVASRLIRSISWGLMDAGPLYWLIVLVHYASDYYRRYQRTLVQTADLNAQLAHAQLQSLKMQLHPHFLFNTLHAISELIHEDPSAAERMIIGLSQLLRLSLETSSAVEVPLYQELRFTQLYLDIEKMRFDDRLEIQIEIDPEVRDAMVPNLILQPLVENAIKHGISRRPGRGQIQLTARKDQSSLVISIRDNGGGLDHRKGPPREGIGLSTTRARLVKLYGTQQSFHFVKRPQEGAEAVLRLPLKSEITKGDQEYVESSDRR